MILRAPGPDPITILPVPPSAAVESWYERELLHGVDQMNADVLTQLQRVYKSAPQPVLPMTFPWGELKTVIDRLEEKWERAFNYSADEIALRFVKRNLEHHDRAFAHALDRSGIKLPKPKPLPNEEITLDGDLPGHEFHGNQWEGGEGGKVDTSLKGAVVQKIIAEHTISELVSGDFWDKLAFGITSGEQKLNVADIGIKWREDQDNIRGVNMKEFFKGAKMGDLPPVDVIYENGRLKLDDGHHRLAYAKQLGEKTINADVTIKDNPFKKLGYYIDDVIRERKATGAHDEFTEELHPRDDHGKFSNAEGSGSGRSVPEFHERSGGKFPITVLGVHYSGQPDLTTLDPSRYGSGARGAESRRIGQLEPGPDRDLISQRAYLYKSENGEKPAPEGVLRNAHNAYQVKMTNIYDGDKDPEHFKDLRDGNKFELAVVKGGYDGYYAPHPGERGSVVLLGTHPVPVSAMAHDVAMDETPARRRLMALDKRDPAVWADFQVKFDLTPRLKRTIQQQLRDNIDLISTKRIKDGPAIPRKSFARLRDMARESIERGRDLAGFTKDLTESFGITRRRASLIARDQNNKMTALFQRTRQLDCGITKAMWVHTAASLKPREEHEEFDRMTYSVEEGHDFDDGFGPVVPGIAVNCGCLSMPIIPGYEE